MSTTSYCPCCLISSDSSSSDESKLLATIILRREELLYDVENYAYIEGHVMGEEQQHAQHTLVDIGQEGNVDRVNRILAVVHAAVTELLYPYTKLSVEDSDEADDRLWMPTDYRIELHVPSDFSRTTLHLLCRLIHEYMVYRVLADWLAITNPKAAEAWAARAEAAAEEIKKAKNHRGKTFTRPLAPW